MDLAAELNSERTAKKNGPVRGHFRELQLAMMMVAMTALDHNHLLVAAMPAVMARHVSARAAIVTVVMAAMHSAVAGFDNNRLRTCD